MSDMLEHISDEFLSSFSKECLKCLFEQSLIDTVGNDQRLSVSPALKSRINGTFVVANENVLLYNSFSSTIPVLVHSYCLLLGSCLGKLVFLSAVRLLEVVHVLEKVQSLLILHPCECL